MNFIRKRSIALVSCQFTIPEDSETAVVRAQDESPNDRNDRGVSAWPPFISPSLRTDKRALASCARNKKDRRMVFVAHLLD